MSLAGNKKVAVWLRWRVVKSDLRVLVTMQGRKVEGTGAR